MSKDCGDRFSLGEIPNVEYFDYMGLSEFDLVVYFSNTVDKRNGWREACGSDKYEDWLSYARKMIIGQR